MLHTMTKTINYTNSFNECVQLNKSGQEAPLMCCQFKAYQLLQSCMKMP